MNAVFRGTTFASPEGAIVHSPGRQPRVDLGTSHSPLPSPSEGGVFSSSLPPCGGGPGWGVGGTPQGRGPCVGHVDPPPQPSPTRGEGERNGVPATRATDGRPSGAESATP